MLIKMGEHLKYSNIFRMPYRGIVVDNADPKKLGRVKCTIPGLIEGDTDKLPWILCGQPAGLGGGTDKGFFGVPEVGSELEIRFPFDDVYSPFYYGYWQSAKTHPTEFDSDYPDVYGWLDSTGFFIKVNKSKPDITFTHPSGYNFLISDSGDFIQATNKFQVTANGEIKMAGTSVDIQGDGTGKFIGKGGTDVGDGGSVTKVDGSLVKLAGGGVGVAFLGAQCVGTGNLGAPVMSQIVEGSSKVQTSK